MRLVRPYQIGFGEGADISPFARVSFTKIYYLSLIE